MSGGEYPMTYREWIESTGGAVKIDGLDYDDIHRMEDIRDAFVDSEVVAVAEHLMSAYHDYICSFVAVDRESRRAS